MHEQWNFIDLAEGFMCMCMAPYCGMHCENTDTVCDSNHPCPNGGQCVLTNICQCITPYTETANIASKVVLLMSYLVIV